MCVGIGSLGEGGASPVTVTCPEAGKQKDEI